MAFRLRQLWNSMKIIYWSGARTQHSCDKSTEQRHENPMKLFLFELISLALDVGGDFPRSHLLHISDYATGVAFNNKYLSSLQRTLKCFSNRNEIISAAREQNKNKSLRGDLSIFEAAQRSPQLVCHNRERKKIKMNTFPIDYSAGNGGGYKTFIVQPVIRNMENVKLNNFAEMA